MAYILSIKSLFTSEVMTNTWLATGTKIKKVTGGITRDYIGGIEYNNGVIEFIQTEEGRARPNGGSYFYEYMLKDHLGNTRMMIDQNGAILETSDYYPFGLQVARAGNTVPSPENRYKYNGKELQTELGLNQYDYGARFYDPVIGRFTTLDPMTEKYFSTSPFVYVLNNPLKYIDPTGMEVEDPDEIFKKQKEHLNALLTYVNTQLKKEGLSKELTTALNGFKSGLNSSLNEMRTLEKSDQVYNIASGSGNEGGVSYDAKSNKVNVRIGAQGSSYGLVGHELKHAFQFESGQISLVVNNSGYGKLYDIGDETESYNRERLIMKGEDYFLKNLQWNNSNVASFGKSMTPAAYQTLPSGPIDVNSAEGQQLKLQIALRAAFGMAPIEIYKGWNAPKKQKK